jgi:hypothetical protein
VTVAELDEVQYDLEVDGEQVREQLSRRVWEKAGWATVAIAFRERDKAGDWKEPKLAVFRFRKLDEVWKKQASFTLGGAEAAQLGAALTEWFTSS